MLQYGTENEEHTEERGVGSRIRHLASLDELP